MILENMEPYLEIINLVFAILIVILGVKASMNLTGKLKRGANYLLIAILLFAIHEVVGILEEFKIFSISGLYTLTETFYIAAFFISIYIFKKLFESLTGGKKIKQQ